MKRKIPHACLVIIVVFASMFLPASASSTEARERPRPAMRAGTDWLGSPLAWLDSFLERIGRDRQLRDRNTMTKAEGEDGTSGVCIDPMGRPRPCPDS